MNLTMNKYRSRKFMLSVGIQVISSIALFSGFIDGANYAMISSSNIASYSFANAAEFFKRDNKN